MTKEQIRAAVEMLVALGEAVRDLGEVPSGHLYARVMSAMSLDQYEAAVRRLVEAGLVRRSPGHLLTWAGPPARPAPGVAEVEG